MQCGRESIIQLMFIIASITAAVAVDEVGLSSANYRLEKDLLKNYKKNLRPVLHPNEALTINVSTSLYQIIKVFWHDAFLKWNPEEYERANGTYISSHDVWTPELYLYYRLLSVDDQQTKTIMNSALDVFVAANGRVRYFLPFTANTLCPLDIKYFPFDQQKCQFQFGAWSHTTQSIQFRLTGTTIELESFYDNQEWMLQWAEVSQSKVERGLSNYSTITIDICILRQSFFYLFNLVFPSSLVTVVALIGFHFPKSVSDSRHTKFRLGIMTLLSMAVLLLSIVDDLPKFSSHAIEGKRGSFSSVPLIGLYYFSLLSLITLGTITSSCLVVLERHCVNHNTPVPRCLVWLSGGMSKPSIRTAEQCYHFDTDIKLNQCGIPVESGNHEGPIKMTAAHGTSATQDTLRLHGAVQELVACVHEILREVINKRRKAGDDSTAAAWHKVVHNMEWISLALYLLTIVIIMILFFCHDWY